MNDQTNTKADEDNADYFKGSVDGSNNYIEVVLLGDAGVGKTYLMNRLSNVKLYG